MKLNFVCPELSGNGGTETVLVKVLNYLAKNHQVKLYLTSIPENKVWLGKLKSNIKVIQISHNAKAYRLARLLKIFLFAKNDEKFIVLSANTIKFAAMIKKLLARKWLLVSWIHYSLANQDMFDPKNVTFADQHWAISTSIKDQLVAMDVPENKIQVLLNPISKYEGPVITTNKTEKLSLVYVGRLMLEGQKNLKELFDGIAQYTDPIHVDLFGADLSNGEVAKYVSRHGIADKCSFHGWTKDPWDKIMHELHSTALVLTSKFEGLPMVMIEAMAHGIPCLVADFSGYEDVLASGVNGYVYKGGDIKDFVNKCHQIRNTNFSPQKIADSIDKFSDENYFKRLDKALNETNSR